MNIERDFKTYSKFKIRRNKKEEKKKREIMVVTKENGSKVEIESKKSCDKITKCELPALNLPKLKIGINQQEYNQIEEESMNILGLKKAKHKHIK